MAPSAAAGNAAYNYTLQVTSVWSSGTQPPATTAALRVPVIHRGGSQYGAGWGVLGLQRILVQPDGLLVDEGDGSARFFAGTGPSYTRPDGDFSTIIRTASGTFHRTWPEGAGAWFDATGRLTYTYTSAGDTTRFNYATGLMLGSIVDPAGQAIIFDYHPGYYLAGITVPGNRRTQFWYTGTDLREIIEPDSTPALQQLSHSAGHRLDSWVDCAGGQWNVTYGPQRAVTVTAPQITANGALHRPSTTVRTEKRLLAPAAGQGTVASPLPRLTADSIYATVTDPRGFTTRAWLDRYGNPLRVVGPLGHATTIERNPHGQPVRVTQPGGTAVNLDWNTDGSIARSFDESRGLQVDYGYQLLNGARFLSRASEGRVNTVYDRGTRGEILRVRVGSDTVARYTYDGRLRVKTMTDRGGHVVEYFYDGTAWKNADSVRFNTSAGNQRTALTYDGAGRTFTVTAPNGQVTTYTYDRLNRVLKQRAPGDSVRYAYNARGLWRVTDAAGKNYDFVRNALGWVVSELDADGDTTAYRYDRGGYLVGTTDRLGRTFGMRYDAVGRLDSLSARDATIRYGFDNPHGNWMWAERVGESRDTLYLDGAGQVYSAVSVMGGVRYEVASNYRVDGRRADVAVRAGPPATLLWQETMVYGYDDRQRLESMTDQSGYATTVGYNAESLPGTITWPNGAATLTLGYTPRHRLGSLSYSRSALNTGLGAGTLGYDILDRVESRTSTDGNRVTSYAYDALGRLAGRDELKQVYVPPPPFCTGNSTEPECDGSYDWASMRTYGYGYDAVGNRTGWTYSDSTGINASYGGTLQASSNRYSAFGGWTLAYDSVGNLVSRTKGAQTVRYHWNSLRQLTSVVTPAGDSVAYGYNGFGTRVRRTAGGVTTRYVYDHGDLVAEVDDSGNRIRTYTYWPGIDQPHSMRTWENGANGAVHYYAMDLPSNTVRGLFNMSGSLTHRYDYSPYGEGQAQSEGTHNPLRFAARELDAQTGMYYVRARWLRPVPGPLSE
ncbi:MAG TPA: hypothetical protein VHG93_19695 [Longimicrobium sp.]|nr:hypothetical protein [Longimicrobium sp.]